MSSYDSYGKPESAQQEDDQLREWSKQFPGMNESANGLLKKLDEEDPNRRARIDTAAQASRDSRSWGGTGQAAGNDVTRYRGIANQYTGMQAPNLDWTGGNRYGAMGDDARLGQTDALGMLRNAANGTAPSQAAILMKQGNDRAISDQLSLAAGARGAGAMAMANQNAMGNASRMATDNANNIGALRAQEMSHARDAYFGGASGMRGQDLNYLQAHDARTNAQGNLGLGYQQVGLQGGLGYERLGWDTRNAQQQGMINQRGQDLGQWRDQMNADAASKRSTEGLIMGSIPIVGGAVGSLVNAYGTTGPGKPATPAMGKYNPNDPGY
jgi:hypothetical protein